MTPKVGLVTVLYNSVDVLPGFFESLAKQDYSSYWLYVIDNSPDDSSLRAAKELAQKYDIANVSFNRNTDNLGVAAGNNQGINLSLDAGCEYVLLLNNDIEFDDTELMTKIITSADSNGESITVPKICYFDTGLIWYAGGNFNLWRGTASHRGMGESDRAQFDIAGYTEYAPTCFMLIHNKVFRKVGLMDEKYFVYYDDTDFVWRANAAGFKVRYWPDGKILHKVGSLTGGDESLFQIYYGVRNRIYFVIKNLQLMHKVGAICFLLTSRVIRFFQYNSKQRSKMLQALAHGFLMSIKLEKG